MNNSLPTSTQRNNSNWSVRDVTITLKTKEVLSNSNIRCPKTDVNTKCNGDYQLCSGNNNTCTLKSLEFTIKPSNGNYYSCTSLSSTANAQDSYTNSIKVPVVTTSIRVESSENSLTRLAFSETSTIGLINSEFTEKSTGIMSDKTSSPWMNFQTSVTFVEESMTSFTVIESTETSMTVVISTLVTSTSHSMNIVTSSIIPTTSSITNLRDIRSMTSSTSMVVMTTLINTPVAFSTNALASITPTKTGITGMSSIESMTTLINTVIMPPKTSSPSINLHNSVTPTKASLTSQPSTDVSYKQASSTSKNSLIGKISSQTRIISLTTIDAIFTPLPTSSNCPADSIWAETLPGHNVTGFYCYRGTVNGKY